MKPAELVDAIVRPELTALAGIDAQAARTRTKKMAGDPFAFYRGSLSLSAWWLTAQVGTGGAWVWANGDPHHQNMCTLRVGAVKRDGGQAVTYDLSDADDEYPAPWRWDWLRLLAGIALVRPTLKRKPFAELIAAGLADYTRVLRQWNTDERSWARIDRDGLPTVLQRQLDEDQDDAKRDGYIERLSDGQHLRLGQECAADPAAKAALMPLLQRQFDHEPPGLGTAKRPAFELLDLARRVVPSGLASLGRRRWLALLCERYAPRHAQLRIIELKERLPSTLARVLAVTPFPPAVAGRADLCVTMGGDPFQIVLRGAGGRYLVRSRCYTRESIDPTTLDDGDALRAFRLWGHLLARYHADGLTLLGVDVAAHIRRVAEEAEAQAFMLAEQARDLAELHRAAWKAFRDAR